MEMNVTLANATTMPPPQLVSIDAALGIGVGVFVVFIAVGLIAIFGCYWPCVFPSMPGPGTINMPGCADWFLCRCFRVAGIWCYVRCCQRSKNYADKVSRAAHDVLASFEQDLEGGGGGDGSVIDSEMVPMRRLLGEEEKKSDDWGDWTDLERSVRKDRID